jgi:hypothetical protein
MPRFANPFAAAAALVLVAGSALVLAARAEDPDSGGEWQDPTVSGRSRLPTRATLLPYATVEQALRGTREA